MERVADLLPCDRCGYTHPRRMIALMSLWFGRFADLPATGGYFYLCPRCYSRLIEPHAEEIVHRLVEQHPFLHSRTPARHYYAEGMPPGPVRPAPREEPVGPERESRLEEPLPP